ncbi:MAG: VTT domain-containing protein [Candidatus Moraniibacteriota bacterium]
MYFFRAIEHFVISYATTVPLPLFVFISCLVEEIVSPLIPAVLVMGTVGSLAFLHGDTVWYLFLLAFIGDLGKTLGAWFYYFVGDRLEHIFIGPMTKYFGIKRENIENIGKRFTGHHWKDGGALFLLRVIPFPTTPVSLACGIIKMDMRVFLLATYVGNFIKDLTYLYVGYAGLASLRLLWRGTHRIQFNMELIVILVIISSLLFLFFHQGRGKKFVTFCKERCLHFFDCLNTKK